MNATEITDEDIAAALDRLARTPDGHLLYRHLQKVLCGVSRDMGTLQEQNGRRLFASELMGLMAKGLEESDGRNTIVFARRAAAQPGGHVSGAEFFAAERRAARELNAAQP